jgi:YYY domain-containing protein
LFTLSIPDASAEEAFTVYDHPRVLIFEKGEGYGSDRTRELLGRNLESRIELSPKQANRTRHGLMLPPERWELQQERGTWSSLFDPGSLPNRYPVATWIIVVEILGLLCFPILLPFTKNLTDKGYSLTKSGGLLLFGWLGWYASSLQIVEFSRATLYGCLVAIILVSGCFTWRYRTRIREIWSSHRGLILTEEVLFLTLFLLFVVIRAANPDLWHPWRGGEKPIDFSYLNAVVKSVSFPPYDPWFAGGYINYYYFGFVLYGAIIKLTGIIPEVGYNLAIPTIFSLTGLGAFGVVLNLLRPGRGKPRNQAIGFALLGTFFVAIVGNLGVGRLLLQRLSQVSSLELETTIPGLQTMTRAVHGLYLTLFGGAGLAGPPEAWYWNASRLISHLPSEPGPITEFPFFTFLFADLHAHAMALPLALLCLGLSVCILTWQPRKSLGHEPLPLLPVKGRGAIWYSGLTLSQWASFGWLVLWAGLALGGLWATNTWDVPAYSLVILAAILLRFALAREGVVVAALAFLAVLFVSAVLFAPFHYWYSSPVGGIKPWNGSNTPFIDFFAVFGVFLVLITTVLWAFLTRLDRWPFQLRIILATIRQPQRIKRYTRLRSRLCSLGALQQWVVRLTVIGILLGLALLVSDFRVAGLCLLLFVLACLLMSQSGLDVAAKLILAISAVGLLMGAGVEVFVVEGDVGRMNTVFKSYLQIWVFWGVASAYAVAKLWKWKRRSTLVNKVWLGTMLSLILVASAYPVVGTYWRVRDRFEGVESWSLDGASFMDSAEFEFDGKALPLRSDRDAVNWLRRRATGTPVIAEANTHPALYRWGNRITMFTGLPSIVGWDWHQRQQRGQVPGGLVERRINDVQRLFNTTDLAETKELLSRYEVKWIVVGSLERAVYDSEGLAKFPLHDGIHWRSAFQSGELVIYEVLD